MKGKKMILFGAIAIVLFVLAFSLKSYVIATPYSAYAENTENLQNTVSNGEVQTVKLSFDNYGYVMEPSTLKKGIPVRMEVDLSTVTGCMRDVVISAFNVRRYVSSGNNIIEFTPDKTGTFNIMCSMGMGRGKFTVAEADGTASSYIEQAPLGGSCAAAGGGCGCGAR
ncbi:hypothetical protein C4573_04585 [Candidatus Woesearchaeota archaeon]|nr:MAG: hypothetical protein C4573_04585 [Candidatus Woesearchaeota archaeon]